ncbi:hypothetical protein GLAREA_07014 [Glarea lozoyensis ATCC 20868]|uniref:Geranylgeranyl pyrophosphate synthetase n=1 Tax=Glarea lozoyensis (strain ATCC 20868 / MF5171) TaxID=1116229 RepID=S3DPH7_GLAL2|nr:uncharacterized protein GLAREA_07014 [Glarea lozoyensis ATCC 20868]EPE34001.1 hypothetical protein GLAREA_07014 [Glarea lozoyensis ATCC 20868]
MAPLTNFKISRKNLPQLRTEDFATITNIKHLASYNWLEAPPSKPTIAVPGSPALWSPPPVPRPLKKDSGLVYIAQNAARHPSCPLEPLFRALYHTHPSFDIRDIDIVSDRNNIRRLLSFIDPSTSRNGAEGFSIDVEVTANTAIFNRNETKTSEVIGPNEFRGYGHEFEKAYTTTQIPGSTGHHRIISYSFSDLKMMIRYETDGYVDTAANPISSTPKPEDDIASLLDNLSLTPNSSKPKLTVQTIGTRISHSNTFEIKTRVRHRTLEFDTIAPQVWISQTPMLVRTNHDCGTFTTPDVEVARLGEGESGCVEGVGGVDEGDCEDC